MAKPETRQEILKRILLGEDSSFEMKAMQFAGSRVSGPSRDRLADELAGFANGSGGVCLLGVDDSTREISGIPLDKLDAAEAFVREIANDSIEPPLLVHIERMNLTGPDGEDHAVLKLNIEPSLLAKCPIGNLDWLKTSRSTMMDRRGEGVRIILEHSERLSGRRPDYRLIDDAELILTIWAASAE